MVVLTKLQSSSITQKEVKINYDTQLIRFDGTLIKNIVWAKQNKIMYNDKKKEIITKQNNNVQRKSMQEAQLRLHISQLFCCYPNDHHYDMPIR